MSEKKPSPTAREKRLYTRPAFVTFRPDAIQAKKNPSPTPGEKRLYPPPAFVPFRPDPIKAKKMAETLLHGSDDECLKLITEMKARTVGTAGSGDPRKPGKNNG